MKRLNFKYSLLLFFVLISCNEKKQICTSKQIDIINNCLNNKTINTYFRIENKNYIVFPYFKRFDFTNYVMKIHPDTPKKMLKKRLILEKIGQKATQFEKEKKKVNSLFEKKYCRKLNDLSSAEKSRNVIRFSGISKKLIFLDIFYFRGHLLSKNLPENYNFNEKAKWGYESYAVLLNKDGSIKEVLQNGYTGW